MRHAAWNLVLAAAILFIAPTARADSNEGAEPPSIVNGIGLIDFSRKPTFKVGDWASYHMTSKSDMGVTDEYTVTVLIAGEDHWWGEDCFWIETWTERPGAPLQSTDALMSYDVFSDSLALPRMQLYVRKTLVGILEDGTPNQNVYRVPVSALRSRELLGMDPKKLNRETLPGESLTTPKGTFACRKERMTQGRLQTGTRGDSTETIDLREIRTTSLADEIPVTHIVREEIETAMTRQAWKAGNSKDVVTSTMDRAKGSAELVDFGHGLTPKLLPESMRKTLAQVRGAAPAARRAAPKPGAAKRRAG